VEREVVVADVVVQSREESSSSTFRFPFPESSLLKENPESEDEESERSPFEENSGSFASSLPPSNTHRLTAANTDTSSFT
jgi:hypothetical protein